MYAIVEIAGQQFKVEEGRKIFVHRLDAAIGSDVEFDKVLLIEDDDKITIGEPVIADFIVGGRVLSHARGDKVIVFKKKRRKGYQVRNGHRQNFTQVEIVSIAPKGAPKKAVKIAESTVAATEAKVTEKEEKVTPVKKAVKVKAAPAEKESAEKKPAAAKKPTAKKPAKDKK
jgi:large subunit ribosomal protein L21